MSRYLVTLSLGGRDTQTMLWDASHRAPKRVGQSLPWTLITRNGQVVLRHKSGRKFEIKTEQIETKSLIALPSIDGDRLTPANAQIKIKKVKAFPSLLDVQRATVGVAPAGSASSTIVSMGLKQSGWVLESGTIEQTFNGNYRARADKREIFQIRKQGSAFELRTKSSQVLIGGIPIEGSRTLSATDLAQTSVEWGRYVWRFAPISTGRLEIPATPLKDLEAEWFKRIVVGVGLGLGLMFLMVSLFSTKEQVVEEKKDDKIFAKIVIKPKTKPAVAAAAPAAKVETPQPKPAQQPPKPAQAKVQPAPPKPVVAPPPPKPEPPKVNQAVLAAQKLQQSMSALTAGGMTSLLKETTIAKGTNQARQSQFLTGKSDAINSAAPTQGLAQQDDVKLSVTDGGGSGSYRWAAPGATGDGTGSGKFLSIGTGDEAGTGSLVEDGLSKREVWEVINRHFSEIRHCYETAITRKADIEGKLIVQFSINSNGAVQKAVAKGSTLKDPRLDQCILDRLVKWSFPKPKGKSEVSVTYPFLFKRL